MLGMVGGGRPDSGCEDWIQDSLFALGGVYTETGDGEYLYIGQRPGSGWHGHGYFSKKLWMLRSGIPVLVRLRKHRWRLAGTYTTCHSRPPDDPVLLRFCTLIVVLRVWSWISSEVGFHSRSEILEDLDDCGTDRSVQRWASRAISNASEIQQSIRFSIIEKVEPRPVESLYKGGLSPPDAVMGRRWRSPADVEALWRAYAMLFVAAKKLAKHASILLAEAQRRWPHTEEKRFF